MTEGSAVIDLTDSFILIDHCGLANDIIEIDDSLREDSPVNTIANTTVPKRKTKIKKTLTPKTQNSKKIEKRSSRNSKSRDQALYGFGDCPICWDELGNNPMASTKCGHVYCLNCLEQYLRQQQKCPTCRKVLKGSSAYHPLYLARH